MHQISLSAPNRLRNFLFRSLVGIRRFGVRQEPSQLVVAEAQRAQVNVSIPEFGQF
jgi:hypothetical protein